MSNIFDNNNKIWNRALDDIMSESFGKYAKYIIQDRALPDIRDGLKPVQRRILYAMYDLNISHDKPYKKSARTVGEVIGKYHPHGDSSIYEAMVRMSQEWKNNITLLDMQGNKGSLDGDGAAAMRYTECRLSKYGEQLLENIEKETVKFIPNFDDSENEPSVLPSMLPNILVNGSTGIAAGYATNVPPFNLTEVLHGAIYRIKNPNCSLGEIASIIKGPDFPMGGIIQGKEGILEMFATGRGKFNIRARIEENVRASKGNKKQLIVTELPYETNKASIVKSIDELRLNNELPGLKEVRDDSDKDGISIVLDFDTEKSLDILKGFLYKKTQLQVSYSANIILIKDRKPCQCSLIDILDAYIAHSNDIVIKASTFELKKALNRKEILEGLIKAISDIDNLVRLIKSSTSKDEAKQKLMDFFELTEKQAEAVVQLRLYVLTSYDTQKLIDEYKELLIYIDIKQKLINDKDFRNKHIIETLQGFDKSLGFKRRSSIEDEIEEIVVKETDIIEENHGVCVVTRDCYVKYMPDTNLTDVDVNKLKIKDGDLPIDMFDLSTLDTLVILTSRGKCLTIPAHKIKMTKIKENGIHVNELITIESSDKAIAAFAVSKESSINAEVLVATKQSSIKRFLVGDIAPAKNAKTTTYINLKDNDEVVSAFVVQKEYNQIITITSSGYAIRYEINEVPVVGRTAAGVKNINLKKDDYVSAVIPVETEESFILLVSNRGGKRIHYEDVMVSGRATIGKRVLLQVESNPYVINSAFMIGGRQSIMMLSDAGKLKEQKVSDIPITDNQTRMNSFPDFEGGITKASFIKKNKNFIILDQKDNFLSLETLKNESKSTVEPTVKNTGLSKELNDLLNAPVQQKEMVFETENIEVTNNDNILGLIDSNEKQPLENQLNDQEIIEEIKEENVEVSDNKSNESNQEDNSEIDDQNSEEIEIIDESENAIDESKQVEETDIDQKENDDVDQTENIEESYQENDNNIDKSVDDIHEENVDEKDQEHSTQPNDSNVELDQENEIDTNQIDELNNQEESIPNEDNIDLENNNQQDVVEHTQQNNDDDQLDLFSYSDNDNQEDNTNNQEEPIDNNDSEIPESLLKIENIEPKKESKSKKHKKNKPSDSWVDQVIGFADQEEDNQQQEPTDDLIEESNDSFEQELVEDNQETIEQPTDENQLEENIQEEQTVEEPIEEDNSGFDQLYEDQNEDSDIQQEEDSNESESLDENQSDDEENNHSIINALLANDNQLAIQLIDNGYDVNETDEDGQTPLMIAANSGNLEIVNKLIENGADVNIQDIPYEYTALMYAVQNDQFEIVQALIDAGADLDLHTEDYTSALSIAMEQNNNEDMGRLLVENGASDPNEYFEIITEDDEENQEIESLPDSLSDSYSEYQDEYDDDQEENSDDNQNEDE